MAEQPIPPLSQNNPITDKEGKPRPFFILLINQLLKSSVASALALAQQALAAVNALIPRVEDLEDADLIAGVGLSGGGTVGDAPLTFNLEDTAVTPGAYTNADVTVDQQGRIVDISDGVPGGVEVRLAGSSIATGVTVLNFIGAAVSITDDGGGQVSITIAGSAPKTPPVIRGHGAQYFNSSSVTITWPTGTVAGDLAIIYVSNGYFIFDPSGWTVLSNASDNVNRVGIYSRVLNSGDIATGSVTVGCTGSFDGTAGIHTIVGNAAVYFVRNGNSSNSVSVATSSSPVVTDLALYFCSTRATTARTITCDQGAQDNAVANAGASIYIGSGVVPTALGFTAVYSLTGGGTDGTTAAILCLTSP